MPAAVSRIAALLLAFVFAGPALAQAQKAPYEPKSGQEGKDVVWVPTPNAVVDKMLELARVTPRDFLMDLGSGDGRTVIAAAQRGTRAMGVEYNPQMVELSRQRAEQAGVSGKATFVKADLFETDFSKATVITMFLLPDINLKLRPKILELKPGTRIVSNTFNMAEWEPDRTESVSGDGCDSSWCTAHLWIVPAKVAGTHKLPQGELELKQEFQKLSGTLKTEGRTLAVAGRMKGDEISFTAGGRKYTGRYDGKTLALR